MTIETKFNVGDKVYAVTGQQYDFHLIDKNLNDTYKIYSVDRAQIQLTGVFFNLTPDHEQIKTMYRFSNENYRGTPYLETISEEYVFATKLQAQIYCKSHNVYELGCLKEKYEKVIGQLEKELKKQAEVKV